MFHTRADRIRKAFRLLCQGCSDLRLKPESGTDSSRGLHVWICRCRNCRKRARLCPDIIWKPNAGQKVMPSLQQSGKQNAVHERYHLRGLWCSRRCSRGRRRNRLFYTHFMNTPVGAKDKTVSVCNVEDSKLGSTSDSVPSKSTTAFRSVPEWTDQPQRLRRKNL